MAAPHVAGALALHAAADPRASEAEARAWLLSDVASRPQGSPQGFDGDPDDDPSEHERVLYLGPRTATTANEDEPDGVDPADGESGDGGETGGGGEAQAEPSDR